MEEALPDFYAQLFPREASAAEGIPRETIASPTTRAESLRSVFAGSEAVGGDSDRPRPPLKENSNADGAAPRVPLALDNR